MYEILAKQHELASSLDSVRYVILMFLRVSVTDHQVDEQKAVLSFKMSDFPEMRGNSLCDNLCSRHTLTFGLRG